MSKRKSPISARNQAPCPEPRNSAPSEALAEKLMMLVENAFWKLSQEGRCVKHKQFMSAIVGEPPA